MGLVAQGVMVSVEAYKDGRGVERAKATVATSAEVSKQFGCPLEDVERYKTLVGKRVELPFTINERRTADGRNFTFIDLVPLAMVNGNGKGTE